MGAGCVAAAVVIGPVEEEDAMDRLTGRANASGADRTTGVVAGVFKWSALAVFFNAKERGPESRFLRW